MSGSKSLPSHGSSAFLARWSTFLAGVIIVLSTMAAYFNSLSSPFIFDDEPAIVKNQTIHHIWSGFTPPSNGGGVIGRPLVNLSLALNYAVGGLQVRGYHTLNLAIHIFAALTLFGIVRRTLLRPAIAGLRRAGSHFAPGGAKISDFKSQI